MPTIDIILSNASGVPFYRQIVDQMADMIVPGLSTPARAGLVRELALQLQVSLITVGAPMPTSRPRPHRTPAGPGHLRCHGRGQAAAEQARMDAGALTQAWSGHDSSDSPMTTSPSSPAIATTGDQCLMYRSTQRCPPHPRPLQLHIPEWTVRPGEWWAWFAQWGGQDHLARILAGIDHGLGQISKCSNDPISNRRRPQPMRLCPMSSLSSRCASPALALCLRLHPTWDVAHAEELPLDLIGLPPTRGPSPADKAPDCAADRHGIPTGPADPR